MSATDPKYRIEANSVDEIAAKLVYLMKLENEAGELEPEPRPRVDVLTCVTVDGSKVRISLSKKPGDRNCRQGIEIDGARLG